MKLLIEIPEEVMETKQYTRYFGACSGKLIETLENGIEFTGRPTGEWIWDSEFLMVGSPYGSYKCSRCGMHTDDNEDNFCWFCGAYMKGGTNDVNTNEGRIHKR